MGSPSTPRPFSLAPSTPRESAMMSAQDHVKNIAIVGASGFVGGYILRSLIEANKFNITAITRQESTATLPSGVHVKKGDYASPEFLQSALAGQDVLIITLAATVKTEIQSDLIIAAAKSEVPWVIPNEYGSDGKNAALCEATPIIGGKVKYRKQIEELGKSSWIGIANSLWFDWSLGGGHFCIDIAKREAKLLSQGTNPFHTTTLAQVGRAVTGLLSLPIHRSSSSSVSLSDYKNDFVCFDSFLTSQKDMLASVQRSTGTTDAEWKITDMPMDQYIQDGRERMAKGDFWGMRDVLYGSIMKEGLGDKYYGRELANDKLGLPKEDYDSVVKGVVEEVLARK